MRIELEKEMFQGLFASSHKSNSSTEIGGSQYVNLSTVSNITFSKGLVVSRDTVMKPLDESNKICYTKSALDMKKAY